MPQDQSPDRRDFGRADAGPAAAQAFDPVAFARRLDVARAQRAEALARRDGRAPANLPIASADAPAHEPISPASAASSDAGGRRDRVNAAAQSAFARPAATPSHAAGQAHRGYAPAGAAFAGPAPDARPASARRADPPPRVAEPLVAPLRRPAPPRSGGASRAAAAALLLLGLAVAAAPPLRERAVDLAAALLPGGVFAGVQLAEQLAEPSPPAGPPAPIAEPRLAAMSETPPAAANRASIVAVRAERAPAGPPLPALGLPAPRADAAVPPEASQPRLARLPATEAQTILTPAQPGAGTAGTNPTHAPDPPTPIPPAPVAPNPAVSGLAAAAPVVAGSPSADAPAAPGPAATNVAPAAVLHDIPRPTAAAREEVAPATPSAGAVAESPNADPPAPAGAAAPRTDVSARVDPVVTAPAAAPSVAVHAPPSISDAALAATMATLETARFGAVRSVRVGMTIERTHVRYYHAADATAARRLAALVAPGGAAEVRDFTHFSPPPAPGRLEAWLSGATAARPDPPSPREAARPAPPAPPAPLPARPLTDPAPKFVIGRQATVARLRPALPLLQRLYAPSATEAPSAPAAPPSPAAPALGAGLY